MAGSTSLPSNRRVGRVRRWLVPALIALFAGLPVPAAHADTPVVTATSTISTLAGSGMTGFAGDGGPAAAAALNAPRDSVAMADGSVLVVDTFNNRIRRIAPDGTISTFAGNGSQAYNGDNIPATESSLSWPHDVTVDEEGVVYIADANHHRIRRVGLDGIITTIAGTGFGGSTGDGGLATTARIKYPKSVAIGSGRLYTSGLDHKVRAIDLATGTITTVVGTGVAGFSGDGSDARSAQLNTPQRLQLDAVGNLYIADTANCAIRRVDAATWQIATIAGVGGACGLSGDRGIATTMRLSVPRGVALTADGRVLYIADTGNHRVYRLDLEVGLLTRIGGSLKGFAGDGGPATSARFYQPRGLSVTASGDLLVADALNNRLRLIAATTP